MSQPEEPTFHALAGLTVGFGKGRPDLVLVEVRTLTGPLRFSMTGPQAAVLAEALREHAEKASPDRGAN